MASPILFDGVFAGKFSAGKAILPWTLLCAMWYSMYCIARIYLWCDERVWLACIGSVAGLGVNVGANLVLLPLWGIQGAAMAASLANVTLLLVVYGLAMRRGMQISLGTWILSAAPVAICFGPWVAVGAIAVLVLLLGRHHVDLQPQREGTDCLDGARLRRPRIACCGRTGGCDASDPEPCAVAALPGGVCV